MSYVRYTPSNTWGNKDSGKDINREQAHAIAFLREIDPIRRKGVYVSAMEQCNEAMRERNIRKDKRKKEILEKTIKTLTKAVAER